MVGNEMKLSETKHPNKQSEYLFESLVAIDEQKNSLIRNLCLLLDKSRVKSWTGKHHKNNLGIFKYLQTNTPLIILSGEVGCGKTALAQSIGTPIAEKLKTKIITMETPSNIRGSGMVGEISNRITEAFKSAKARIGTESNGILIIDEADDIATSRAQNQAHHEDRAGLNVLIKQLDLLKREQVSLVVIMITNRFDILDPAVLRRANLNLIFDRPEGEKLKVVFESILDGVKYRNQDINKLIDIASSQSVAYSFSDLIQRAGRQALMEAIDKDMPFGIELYTKTLQSINPTPPIEIGKLN